MSLTLQIGADRGQEVEDEAEKGARGHPRQRTKAQTTPNKSDYRHLKESESCESLFDSFVAREGGRSLSVKQKREVRRGGKREGKVRKEGR